MRYWLLVVWFAVATLSGCEDKPPARTVFDPQIKALEKARAVEGKMQDAAKQRADEAEAEGK